jgi:hypothetical protein
MTAYLLGANPAIRNRKKIISTECLGCGAPFRDRRTRVTEAPGTKLHRGKGLCLTCYGGITYTQMAIDNYERNLSSLKYFINYRRRRGVPAEGYLFEGES